MDFAFVDLRKMTFISDLVFQMFFSLCSRKVAKISVQRFESITVKPVVMFGRFCAELPAKTAAS